MSGAFYGSLAASASVFVAILTALLVNNYVRIKSERRRVRNELQRVTEELEGLRERKKDHKGTVDELEEKRESDYREVATENLDEFIEARIPSDDPKPIEKISIEELYSRLISFHDCESPEELEREPIEYRHQEIIEERMDEIEDKILNAIIPSFASQYRGRGQSIKPDSESKSFAERVEEIREDQAEVRDDEDESDITVKAEFKDRLSLEDFIEKYREEYGLSNLNDKTVEVLETNYNEVVDTAASIDGSITSVPSRSINSSLAKAAFAAQGVNETFKVDLQSPNEYLGLNPREQQKLSQEQEKLRGIKNEISILKNRKERIERDLRGLNPEDLNSTLLANVATIILSVVVPIAAYLDTVTAFTVTQLHIINIWWIFTSWLIGLIIVFTAIFWKINNGSDNDGTPQEEPDPENKG